MFERIPTTTVIALGHRARQGKNLAARIVREHYPAAHEFGFADALKALCRVQWGMTAKDSPLLQRVGVAMRVIDPEVWLRALYWSISEHQPRIALITDMRFPNEFDLIKAIGGYAVKIERRTSDGRLVLPADRDPHHESEEALARETRWDAVIENPDGDVEEFTTRVLDTVRPWVRRLGDTDQRQQRGDPYGQAEAA